jgi:hypothetical protein
MAVWPPEKPVAGSGSHSPSRRHAFSNSLAIQRLSRRNRNRAVVCCNARRLASRKRACLLFPSTHVFATAHLHFFASPPLAGLTLALAGDTSPLKIPLRTAMLRLYQLR